MCIGETMNFEEGFDKEYASMFPNKESNAALLLAFKEVARHSWNAALHYRQTPYGLREIKDEK
jgi:hypothetical protein